jgi:predicted GNAT family N-acyltransferase
VKNLLIKKVNNKQDFDNTLKIRKVVFIEEQKVPLDIELDGLDNEAEHFIAYLDDKEIGCARIRIKNRIAKLERIAIIKKHRNKGFGTKLTFFLINYCKKKDFQEIILHSQTYVSDFYKKFDFKKRGSTFYEAGIEHIEMFLEIS